MAADHEACLGHLLEHVAAAIEGQRAGQLDRAARQLWTFGWTPGGGSDLEVVAGTIELLASESREIDWCQRSAPRGRGVRP